MFTYVAGEFGIVYKAHLTKWHGNGDPKVVAVKTLKGVFITVVYRRNSLKPGMYHIFRIFYSK